MPPGEPLDEIGGERGEFDARAESSTATATEKATEKATLHANGQVNADGNGQSTRKHPIRPLNSPKARLHFSYIDGGGQSSYCGVVRW